MLSSSPWNLHGWLSHRPQIYCTLILLIEAEKLIIDVRVSSSSPAHLLHRVYSALYRLDCLRCTAVSMQSINALVIWWRIVAVWLAMSPVKIWQHRPGRECYLSDCSRCGRSYSRRQLRRPTFSTKYCTEFTLNIIYRIRVHSARHVLFGQFSCADAKASWLCGRWP